MRFIRLLIVSGALAATLLLSLPLVAGFFGWLHPAFDSFGHFRAHLAVLMALAALPLLFTSWRLHAVAALVLAAGALHTTGLSWPLTAAVQAAPEAIENHASTYRALQLNLRYDNRHPDKVFALIERARPDFILLDEVSEMWRRELAGIEEAYPHRLFCPGGGYIGGTAILSRRPFRAHAGMRCSPDAALSIATVVLDDERTLDVAALHLRWPWPSNQAWQIGALTPLLGGLAPDTLLTGDLNAAPWSHAARRVAAAGELRTEPTGPTWLTRRLPTWLRPIIGLPIDHVYAKGGVAIISVRRLEEVGSDHLPVLVDFTLPATVETIASASRPSDR